MLFESLISFNHHDKLCRLSLCPLSHLIFIINFMNEYSYHPTGFSIAALKITTKLKGLRTTFIFLIYLQFG